MNSIVDIIPFEPANPEHIQVVSTIWNNACGSDLAITNHFVDFNTSHAIGIQQAGRLAVQDGHFIGVILASMTNPARFEPFTGTIDITAVLPEEQGKSIGTNLLAWAEDWLRSQGCRCVQLGAGQRPFTPGVPVETGSGGYFMKNGYHKDSGMPFVWDMARSLKNYDNPDPLKPLETGLIPVQPGQKAMLENMMRDGFSSFWLYEFQELQREGGRLDEYLILLSDGEPVGFCQIADEESLRPIERFYMRRLPHPWGQMGTFGIIPQQRGKGFGAILIDAAARFLRDRGIDGCVIDWTAYLDLYGKFGFMPFRQYLMLRKTL